MPVVVGESLLDDSLLLSEGSSVVTSSVGSTGGVITVGVAEPILSLLKGTKLVISGCSFEESVDTGTLGVVGRSGSFSVVLSIGSNLDTDFISPDGSFEVMDLSEASVGSSDITVFVGVG